MCTGSFSLGPAAGAAPVGGVLICFVCTCKNHFWYKLRAAKDGGKKIIVVFGLVLLFIICSFNVLYN
jgi:hypothetical protein